MIRRQIFDDEPDEGMGLVSAAIIAAWAIAMAVFAAGALIGWW